MRPVTTQEFDSLIEDREEVFKVIGKIFDEQIKPQLIQHKERLVIENKALTYDIVFIADDVWGDKLPCAAVTTFWWRDDTPQARVSHFLIYNDEEEMMKNFGDGKMKELNLPRINPN